MQSVWSDALQNDGTLDRIGVLFFEGAGCISECEHFRSAESSVGPPECAGILGRDANSASPGLLRRE